MADAKVGPQGVETFRTWHTCSHSTDDAGAAILVEVEIREVASVDVLVALFAAVLPSSFALGAYIDAAPVGLAWGIHMRSPSGRLTTYVHELDVHENWRRQGVGSALIRAAMEVARRHGSTKFWLSTGGHNKIAQALYESLRGDRKPLGDVNYWWDLD